MQHPTFRYDMRGQGDIVLTRPESYAAVRARVAFPKDLQFLLMRDSANGPVVAELSEYATTRTLSLRAGRYFVRARGRDVLYEGELDAAVGGVTSVELDRLSRIEYAHLVRKGPDSGRRLAHAFEMGSGLRSILPNAETPCIGGFAGYGMDFSEFGARARLGMCTSGFENREVLATGLEYDFDVRIYHAWDLGPFALELGLGGGASFLSQHFELVGNAPVRNTLVPFVSIGTGAELGLAAGIYLSVDVAGETHFLRIERSVTKPIETEASFAVRSRIGVGKHF